MEIRCRHRLPSPELAGCCDIIDQETGEVLRDAVDALRDWPRNIRICGPARSIAGTGCIERPARSVEIELKCRLKVQNTKKARWGNTGPRRMKTCELFIKTLKTVCPQPGLPSRERCEYGRLFQGLAQD